MLDHSGATLGPPRGILGLSWGLCGAVGAILGPLGAILWPYRGHSGVVLDPPPKKRKNGSQKYWKKPYEVHLEVTRLERHAIFRRSISLDDVDCFDTLKSQTYQWHEFITLLFQGLRGPFRVVLMRTSCQSRFLCDVIE